MQTIFMLLKLFECVQDEQERVLITQSVFYVATKSPQLLTDRTYNLQILQKCFQTVRQYSGFDDLIQVAVGCAIKCVESAKPESFGDYQQNVLPQISNLCTQLDPFSTKELYIALTHKFV